jgi:hypothetical protein
MIEVDRKEATDCQDGGHVGAHRQAVRVGSRCRRARGRNRNRSRLAFNRASSPSRNMGSFTGATSGLTRSCWKCGKLGLLLCFRTKTLFPDHALLFRSQRTQRAEVLGRGSCPSPLMAARVGLSAITYIRLPQAGFHRLKGKYRVCLILTLIRYSAGSWHCCPGHSRGRYTYFLDWAAGCIPHRGAGNGSPLHRRELIARGVERLTLVFRQRPE